MAVNIGQIVNPLVYINPSKKLQSYIRDIKISPDIPNGLKNFVFKNKLKYEGSTKLSKLEYLTTDADRKFIKSLVVSFEGSNSTIIPPVSKKLNSSDKLLSLHDLHWLYSYIKNENKCGGQKVYLHELLEGSDVILPKNQEIPRSEELDKRCKRLKAEQDTKEYQKMTKNVDNSRKRLPEDTIGYQIRQLNKQLIAIFQFILSVVAGFAFGFIGVELLIGNLDFGFRLLLGIICALVIALAELYFLAKKLNEDLQYEQIASQGNKNIKVD
ncbi:transmembrane protein 199 [Cylas formicarius]|uniref:transmembrane protein 199 n=1 Tax=Cylas formicarius TaxID=197179 RepID=UPI002958916C|nr:transmembrane protein 199 [Cylas formicarius]